MPVLPGLARRAVRQFRPVSDLLLALAFSLTFVLTACNNAAPPPSQPARVTEGAQVRVVELRRVPFQAEISAYGVIEALEEVNVAAELSGTVASVHVDEGDRVAAGDLLLALNPQKREFAAQQAQQAVQRALATLKEARLKLERRRDLAAKESVSREVLDTAQLAVDAAAAAYREAMASHELAQRELADTQIFSPTAGLVDVQAVAAGEPVRAGATLIKLQAVAGLRVHTWVSEADITHIRSGNAASVTTAGLSGRAFPAKVEWVGVKADPSTGNFPVKLVLFEASDSLRPGMTARVQLQTNAIQDALLLPERALVDRDRKRVVFVVENGVAHMREPLLAAGFTNRLRVLHGLDAGDRVVIDGHTRLLDGAAVRLIEED